MKKTVKLTEEELKQVINESVQTVLNEIDGATHAKVINLTDRIGVRGRFNFKPRDIRKLMNNETILNGDIFYDNETFNGNILINIANNRVYYIAKKQDIDIRLRLIIGQKVNGTFLLVN